MQAGVRDFHSLRGVGKQSKSEAPGSLQTGNVTGEDDGDDGDDGGNGDNDDWAPKSYTLG